MKRFSVLYAEDDISIRSKYAKLLKLYFKDVYEVSNGEEAIETFKKVSPDVVILDINMPVINGLKAAKFMRKENKDLKIVMFTAYSDKDKLLEAINLRVMKYLIKPINTFELEELLEDMIKELERECEEKDIVYLEGGFYWDMESEELFDKGGLVVKLTKKEILLLKLFCEHKQKIFSNDEILNYVWEEDFGDTNTNKLRILFSKLKSKLSFNLFSSTYNVGYKINLKN